MEGLKPLLDERTRLDGLAIHHRINDPMFLWLPEVVGAKRQPSVVADLRVVDLVVLTGQELRAELCRAARDWLPPAHRLPHAIARPITKGPARKRRRSARGIRQRSRLALTESPRPARHPWSRP